MKNKIRNIEALRNLYRVIHPPIIVFGLPRSGNTLMGNVLRTVFPTKYIDGKHILSSFDKSVINRSTIICPIRNPLDSICSSMLRYEISPSEQAIKTEIKRFEKFGMPDILKIKTGIG